MYLTWVFVIFEYFQNQMGSREKSQLANKNDDIALAQIEDAIF